MKSIGLTMLALAGCDATRIAPGQDDPNLDRSCGDPAMSAFPVADAHNIGWDPWSCGSGTCDISCPDQNANSDFSADHHGNDLFAYFRAPIVAVTDGVIYRAGWYSSSSGNRIRLRDDCGWEYWYGHLDEITVPEGATVHAGDLIGYMGSTGTTSVHTHFNISFDGDWFNDVDPFDLLAATSATACGGIPTTPGTTP
ncbi:MAG: M23 family metallopeptidase, partial [Myxococcota bacterium]